MDTTQIKKYGMVVVFLGLFVLVSMIYLPFLTVFIWSGLFYAFLSPVYRRLIRSGERERGSFACKGIAGLLAVGSVLLIAVPGVILGITIVKQLSSIVQQTLASIEANPKMVNSLGNGPIGTFLSAISGGSIDLATTDIGNAVRHFLASRTNQILGLSGKIIKDSLGIVVNLVFMIFTLFFFLIDGQHLLRILIGALPIEKRYTLVFLGKFRDMGRQLVIGYILIAILQALIMVTLCLIFSVKGGLLIGFLTALASFIPMVGTALVWLPISASMFVAGDLTGAVLFFVLSAALVWTTDNLLRPLLLHGRLKIHPLLILFSILGGLRVFKFNGLVLGPLILILFFAAVELNEKEEVEASQNGTAAERSEREGR
jgi:predicted PurR-regulated permease PerM